MSKYYEIDSNGNQVPTESNGLIRQFVALSDVTTLTYAHSGKILLLDAIGEAITLPAVATSKGFSFKFLCTAATATSNWTIVAATAVVYGSAQVAGAVVAASANTTITLVVAKFLPGDWITLDCDGVKWFVEGSVVTALGATFTGA